MSFPIVIAFIAGLSVGQIPDEGPVWSGIHLVISAVLFLCVVRLAQREARLNRDAQRR